MSKPPKTSLAAQKIQASGLSLQHFRCLATDPIDMDHLFAVDPEISRQVAALRLETDAKIHETMAGAAAQAAKLMKNRG
jgi:hypothetical protein